MSRKQKIPVVWVDSDARPLSRQDVDPYARQGWKDVNLAWLRKHAVNVTYKVRWWEGPDGHNGKWVEVEFPGDAKLTDVKAAAFACAGINTPWEVEVTMHARTHDNRGCGGWSYGKVWTFGHYKRMTDEAKRIRGDE